MMTPDLAKRITAEMAGKVVGGWTIGPFCGHGASAVVLEATRDRERGAVKLYDRDLVSKDETAELERIQRQLGLRGHDHPNLVQIYDGGKCDESGYLYVVMEHIADPPLYDQLPEVPREQLRNVFSQVAKAANYLHHRDLVHRDIKPQNVSMAASTFKTKLLDLGVVRPTIGETVTDQGSSIPFLGTKRYSPPEFYKNRRADDAQGWLAITFYQLGAVLHDLIMRKRLFDEFNNDEPALMRAVEHDVPQVFANDVPHDLIQLAKDCLLKDPLLRLRFVTWDRFLGTGDTQVSQSTDLSRLRLAHLLATEKPSPHLAEGRQFRLQSVAKALSRSIDGAIRAVCVDPQVFPPIEITEPQTIDKHAFDQCLTFRFTLPKVGAVLVRLVFRTQILDVVGPSVELSVACCLSATETPVTVTDKQLARLFGGSFDPSSVQNSLQLQIPLLLSNALELATASPGLLKTVQFVEASKGGDA